MQTNMRAFFAIELPPVILQKLKDYRAYLKKTINAPIQWTNENHLHITLRFLAQVNLNTLQKLTPELTQQLSKVEPINLVLHELKTFPRRHPHVLILDVLPVSELQNLFSVIEKELVAAEIAPESRPLAPHLTLGRLHLHKPLDLSMVEAFTTVETPIESITLFQSELSKRGAVHTPLASFKLGKNC